MDESDIQQSVLIKPYKIIGNIIRHKIPKTENNIRILRASSIFHVHIITERENMKDNPKNDIIATLSEA